MELLIGAFLATTFLVTVVLISLVVAVIEGYKAYK